MFGIGWKTILGGVISVFGYVSDPGVLAVLPHKVSAVVTAIGGFLALIGIRHAVAKTTPK